MRFKRMDPYSEGEALVGSAEAYLDCFGGFVRSWLPFPSSNSIDGRLGEHGVTTLDIGGLDCPVRSDDHIESDHSRERHAAGQGWILSGRVTYEFALRRSFLCACSTCWQQAENEQDNPEVL